MSVPIREAIRESWPASAGIMGLSVMLGVLAAFALRPIYRSEVVLLAAQEEAQLGTGQLLSAIGGIASLAGLGASASFERQANVEYLRSYTLAKKFVEKTGIALDIASAANQWTWQRNNNNARASIDIAVRRFRRQLVSVTEDRRTGVIRLALLWPDRVRAASLANEYVALANLELRTQSLQYAQQNLAYLQQQLTQAQVLSLQQAISRLMESQMSQSMLASGREDYAFRVVDEATASPEGFYGRPNRRLIVLAAVAVGLLLAGWNLGRRLREKP